MTLVRIERTRLKLKHSSFSWPYFTRWGGLWDYSNGQDSTSQWAGSFWFPLCARCLFRGRPSRPAMLEVKRSIPWYQPRTSYAAMRSRSRCPWAWWWCLLAIISLHCLPRLAIFSKTGTSARRKGAIALQLPRATRNSDFQPENLGFRGFHTVFKSSFLALFYFPPLFTSKNTFCWKIGGSTHFLAEEISSTFVPQEFAMLYTLSRSGTECECLPHRVQLFQKKMRFAMMIVMIQKSHARRSTLVVCEGGRLHVPRLPSKFHFYEGCEKNSHVALRTPKETLPSNLPLGTKFQSSPTAAARGGDTLCWNVWWPMHIRFLSFFIF